MNTLIRVLKLNDAQLNVIVVVSIAKIYYSVILRDDGAAFELVLIVFQLKQVCLN